MKRLQLPSWWALMVVAPMMCAAAALQPVMTYTAPRQVNGLPDWSGVWGREGSGSLDPSVPMGQYQYSAPFTAQARKTYDTYMRDVKSGKATNNIGCLPEGVPRILRAPFPVEFVVTPKETWMLAEFKRETRRIYTDGRKPPAPADLDPTYEGFSVGHWEGDTLVVETTGLKAGTLDSQGLVHSDRMTVHERIRRVSPTDMDDTVTITDPVEFVRPWRLTRTWKLQPDWMMDEYDCEENNRNPVGNQGVAGFTTK